MPLKTEESKATLPLPRSAALMLLEHRARSLHRRAGHSCSRPVRDGRWASATFFGRCTARRSTPARRRAADFPELFGRDEQGHPMISDRASLCRASRPRELKLPDFHSLRHAAAMDCDDAEEARDLLRHKNSNVTRAIYRAHFSDRRRSLLRARMEARMETSADT